MRLGRVLRNQGIMASVRITLKPDERAWQSGCQGYFFAMRYYLLILTLLAAPGWAQSVTRIDPGLVADLLPYSEDFNFLPDRPEPGFRLDHGYAIPKGRIGRSFVGQTMGEAVAPDGGRFDAILTLTADAPLRIAPNPPGQGLSVSWHRAYGSNALYGVGPVGWPDPPARGEGSIAILFAEDVCAVALKVHTEYVDDLGTNAGHVSMINFAFVDRDGRVLDQILTTPGEGITEMAFRLGTGPGIAGMVVENRDPGGISIDDLSYGCTPLIG